jgi:hypothetical protein
MKTRDVANIAFRFLAAWVMISALNGLVELLVNSKAVWAQAATWSGVSNAPTPAELLWMSAAAMLGNLIVGLIAWWLSPVLARLACPRDETFTVSMTRYDAYAASSFLVGLWLVATSAPPLAWAAYAATRPGVPLYPEARPQVPPLLAQCVLGIALLRGQWLIRWAATEPESAAEDTEPADRLRPEAGESGDGQM